MSEHWYHVDGIFSIPLKPASVALIGNFDNIQWNDQELLKQKVGRRRSEPTKGTSKVMVVSPITLKRPTLDDFDNYRIEYARSSDTECYCKDLIEEEKLPPVNNENLPPAAKRAHLNTVKTAGMNDMDIKMMIQNEKFFNMRNKLENQKVT
ncbi:uncharacterized protein [Chelonus insularis]|uniref:uncharacterized protein isoform X3 n=1 Tax=Chelonus insularis TaxID=460826 RepID=UPI00158E01E4|nr:uncharacterized protein LOC118066519 isoform X3 [Chelonus insularis]